MRMQLRHRHQMDSICDHRISRRRIQEELEWGHCRALQSIQTIKNIWCRWIPDFHFDFPNWYNLHKIGAVSYSTMSLISKKQPTLCHADDVSRAKGFLKIVDLKTKKTILHQKTNNYEISFLKFNQPGNMLFSSSVHGKSFHVYKIIHPVSTNEEFSVIRL